MSNKSSKSTQDKALDPSLGGKRQARRRLVGAAIVCAAATAGLFAVLDRDPKPLGPDVVLKGTGQSAPLSPPIAEPAPVAAPSPVAVPPVVLPAPDTALPKEEPPPVPQRPPLVVNPLPPEVPKVVEAPKAAKPDPIEKLAQEKLAQAKKPAEPKSTADKPNSDKGYALQVGAFASKESANNAMAKLKAAGVSGFTETITTPGGERTRVRAGPYKNREAAQAALAKLKAAGIEAALIAP
jgi:DedD protein